MFNVLKLLNQNQTTSNQKPDPFNNSLFNHSPFTSPTDPLTPCERKTPCTLEKALNFEPVFRQAGFEL